MSYKIESGFLAKPANDGEKCALKKMSEV